MNKEKQPEDASSQPQPQSSVTEPTKMVSNSQNDPGVFKGGLGVSAITQQPASVEQLEQPTAEETKDTVE